MSKSVTSAAKFSKVFYRLRSKPKQASSSKSEEKRSSTVHNRHKKKSPRQPTRQPSLSLSLHP